MGRNKHQQYYMKGLSQFLMMGQVVVKATILSGVQPYACPVLYYGIDAFKAIQTVTITNTISSYPFAFENCRLQDRYNMGICLYVSTWVSKPRIFSLPANMWPISIGHPLYLQVLPVVGLLKVTFMNEIFIDTQQLHNIPLHHFTIQSTYLTPYLGRNEFVNAKDNEFNIAAISLLWHPLPMLCRGQFNVADIRRW